MLETLMTLGVAWAAVSFGFLAGCAWATRNRERAIEANREFFEDQPNVVALSKRMQARARARLDQPGFGP